MFGKKKNMKIKAIHYEGILEFSQNTACEIEIKENVFEMRRIKPETIVSLAMDKIIKFESLSEVDFMARYHNCSVENVKGNIPKTYLVITYTSKDEAVKWIAFWGTPIEAMKFTDLQYKYVKEMDSYSL